MKQLTYNDRLNLEVLLKAKHSPKEIAGIIGVDQSTIYRELKRGRYVHRNSDWTEEVRYSPELAQAKKNELSQNKGRDLKIGNNIALANEIERLIIAEKNSPAAALANIRRSGKFKETICVNTLYSYIKKGVFLHLSYEHLPEKKKRQKRGRVVVQKRAVAGTSIEKRPEHIQTREEFGHWEMDTVVGAQGKTKKALLVLTERKTRKEKVVLMKERTARETVKALDRIERELGEKKFREIFKSITVDNGMEFSDVKGLERSRRNKRIRTKMYYCHPYSSYERGSNENNNRLVRRHIPKGFDFQDISRNEVKAIENWINDYPREMFGWRSAGELFREELNKLYGMDDLLAEPINYCLAA